MCGIAGWIDCKNNLDKNKSIIQSMTQTLVNRGPDEEGYHYSPNALLGHRRLVVIDPAGGKQPMKRVIGNNEYVIVYNGELYNTEDLRKELIAKGHKFNAHSDTEVLLVSYIEWGEKCVEYLNGIYAFAVWEEHKKTLFMARDRLGVKPLFYSIVGSSIIFGSEIKTLLANPHIEAVLDEEGIMELFALGPARSLGTGIFKGVKELKPAEYIVYNEYGLKSQMYWQVESKEFKDTVPETIENIKFLVNDAIKRQLVADVPLCTFLSGGLDSSTISTIASQEYKKQGKQLQTFNIDYVDNDKYFKKSVYQPNSDAYWVVKMSQAIGSNHKKIELDIPDLINALDIAVEACDLPGMADVDSSLYLFCKEVKKDCVVALSGECADEIFGGYPWYTRKEDIFSNTFPWAKSVEERTKLLSAHFKKDRLKDYVDNKFNETINEAPLIDSYSEKEKKLRQLFYLNFKWFMITLLNRKDRMSMSNGLEVRVPFADHRIVEYTWNIPWETKFHNGREKGLLREALRGILPDEIIERKKSPYPKTHHPVYSQMVQKKMMDIINDKSSPLLDLVDHKELLEITKSLGQNMKNNWFGQLMTGPQLLAYFYQINYWLKKYKVRIEA